MKKKISLVLSFILAFTFLTMGNVKTVKAEEKDAVIGTSNLNNTPDNSGKVGNQLYYPEKGWKRYDDNNSKIVYDSNWTVRTYANAKYKSTDHYTVKDNASLKFKFSGNKIRIISQEHNKDSVNMIIKIDKEEYKFTASIPTNAESCIAFEKLDLSDAEHSVEIINHGVWYNLDAIDIDENGELKPYEENKEIKTESITLNKSSISLLKDKTEQLIATVKPDNATNKKVNWSSSDTGIARVAQDGTITAIGKGQAKITAIVDGTEVKATCDVNVTEPNKNRAILAITMVNGITKEYDVASDEIDSFTKWFDASNGKGQLRYGFDKTIKPYKTVKEYVVFDKIASFEVREYETDK